MVRGQRIVLGGNPEALPFQTTEGVVTGEASGRAFQPCGTGRNCIVIDASSLGGSSGGPAVNADGRIVGMLWGGPTTALHVWTLRGNVQVDRARAVSGSLAFLIHARTIAEELRRLEAH